MMKMPGTGAVCLLLVLVASLAGCAARTSGTTACAPGLGTPMRMFDLFFGRSIPGGGTVSADDWDRFLDDTVTPNLPAGYTVLDGTGAWRNPMTGQTGREPSIVILGVLPDTPDSLAAVNRVRAAYQRRFHQQLVGMASVPVCGAF